MTTIMDLSDELILSIWSHLTNVDILHTFTGLNHRFNRLIRDDTVTRSLVLLPDNAERHLPPLPASIFDSLCLQVLPEIHDRVRCLTFEPMSMGRILSAGSYPSLHQLTLTNVDQDCIQRHFTGNVTIDSSIKELFQRRITHLTVIVKTTGLSDARIDMTETIMISIFSLFANLVELDIYSLGYHEFYTRLQLIDPSVMRCFSSALVRLRINVETFDDCLYLLDGRLPHLQQLDIVINKLLLSDRPPSMEILPHLKIFSFASYCKLLEYNTLLIPLFSRMKFLEELNLHLWMRTRTVYIDGTRLNEEILIHMPRLQKLALHIDTWSFRKKSTLPIPEMIDDTLHVFHNGRHYELIRYYDHHLYGRGRCHLYSIPYGLDDFQGITNRFPGGSFPLVRHVGLLDMYSPFEHEFFLRISHSFPFLTTLSVSNDCSPTNKRFHQLDSTMPQSSPVEFKHLTNLDLNCAITDYIEYFLIDVNVHMPRLKKLAVPYANLVDATGNFTRNETRRTSSKIESVVLSTSVPPSREFYEYFCCSK